MNESFQINKTANPNQAEPMIEIISPKISKTTPLTQTHRLFMIMIESETVHDQYHKPWTKVSKSI